MQTRGDRAAVSGGLSGPRLGTGPSQRDATTTPLDVAHELQVTEVRKRLGRRQQAVERVKLLTQENAELRAELGAMKDRLSNVERIVTDSGYHLTHEIDRLRDSRGEKDVN